ncbi:Multidrug resistance protein pgp-3 [Aphelenchoides besseyi]|nr:Multidrug resistance protein pgp-3 [Aphelenchoides besseyi]
MSTDSTITIADSDDRPLKDGSLCPRQKPEEDKLLINYSAKQTNFKLKRMNEEDYKPASFLQMVGFMFLSMIFGFFDAICNNIRLDLTDCRIDIELRLWCDARIGITNTLMTGQAAYEADQLDLEWISSEMIYYSWAYAGLAAVSFVSSGLAMTCFFTLAERQAQKIRMNFLAKCLEKDAEWFDRNNIGELIEKMSTGIDQIRNGCSDKLAIVIHSFVSLCSGMIVSFYISWRMALVMLLIVPVVVVNISGSAFIAKSAIRRETKAYGKAGALATEVLAAIRTVLAFNSQPFEVKRYFQILSDAQNQAKRRSFSTAYGSWLVMQGLATPGSILAAFWAACGGAFRLGSSLPQIPIIVSAQMAAGQILAIINKSSQSEKRRSSDGRRLSHVDGDVVFRDVHFAYPTRPSVKVLRGLSFSTSKDCRRIALVGHSGSGKSSARELLMKFYEHSSGSITIDGVPIRELNTEWLRSEVIAVVPQDPVTFMGTIAENLRAGREYISDEEMIRTCQKVGALDFIRRLPKGYLTRIENATRLSGGEKQRIAIARALLRKPRIIVLDEATSALDVDSERKVQECLNRLSSEITIITIAHRMSTVRNADRIFVVDNGCVVESGSHSELMKSPQGAYRRLVESQAMNSNEEPKKMNVEDEMNQFDEQHIEESLSRASSRHFCQSLSSSVGPLGFSGSTVEIANKANELNQNRTQAASFYELAKYARPERLLLVFGLISTLIAGMSWPAFSVIYGQLFNSLSNTMDINVTQSDLDRQNLINAASFITLGFISGASTFTSGFFLGLVGVRLTGRLRMDAFKVLLRQDGYFYDKVKQAVLTERLSKDTANVAAAVDQRLADVFSAIAAMIAGLLIAFYFDWLMAAVGLTAPTVIVISQLIITIATRRRAQEDAEIAEESSSIAAESITHVRTVQALNQQSQRVRLFIEASVLSQQRNIVRGRLQAACFAITACFFNANFATAYFLGMLLISAKLVTPFHVFQVIESLNMSAFSIVLISAFIPEFIKARISANLVFRLLAQHPQIDSGEEKGGRQPEITGAIEFDNICFAYPLNPTISVLRNFSIDVPANSTLALIGLSGSGKSTTIQLVQRLYDVVNGSIRFDGIDLRELDLRYLRTKIGVIGQNPTLFNLSIGENIAYGSDDVTDAQIVEAAKLANIHNFVQSLPKKYDTSCGSSGAQLSGGQKQRLAIARALVRNPRILLLDEATSALDTESERAVQEALDKVSKNRTTIVIAHRLSTIRNANQIAYVENGRIVEVGNHDQLIAAKGAYYRLVNRKPTN